MHKNDIDIKGYFLSTHLKSIPEIDQENDSAEFHHLEKKFADLSQREKRSLIFHFLYAAESFDYQVSLDAIVDNFNRGFDLDIPMDSDVVKTAHAIIESQNALDEEYKPLLSNWKFDRLGTCTKLILRFALWELKYTDTNPTIIINEAIELAKCFAEKDAYKFINGVLDKAASANKLDQPEEEAE